MKELQINVLDKAPSLAEIENYNTPYLKMVSVSQVLSLCIIIFGCLFAIFLDVLGSPFSLIISIFSVVLSSFFILFGFFYVGWN